MKSLLRFILPAAVGAVILLSGSCDIRHSLNYTLTVTNIVQPNLNITNYYTVIELVKYTNVSIITNPVYLTNGGYVLQGNIYITNTFNEQEVQPTFKIMGTVDGDLADFIPNGSTSLSITVTNSGFSTNGKVWTPSPGTKAWEAVAYQQTTEYIFVRISANLTGFGSYSMALNFHTKNTPYLTFDKAYDGTVTNAGTISLSGKAYVTSPATVSKVLIYHLSEQGATNSIYDTSLGGNVTGWTNTILSRTWMEPAVNLTAGKNYLYSKGISSSGLTNSYPVITITKALIGVDGIKDTIWNSAPMIGQSLVATYSGYKLSDLRMTNDANNLYLWVGAGNLPAPISAGNGVRIAVALDTKADTAGVTKDMWGGVFVYNPTNNYLPDFQLQCRIQSDGGGQAVYQASGTNWTMIAHNWQNGDMHGVQMSVIYTNGFEIAVPLSFFSLIAGDKVRAIVTLSGIDGDNGNSQAWDAIPECTINQTVTNENQLSATYLGAYCPPYTVQ